MLNYSIISIALLFALAGSALATVETIYPTEDSYIMESEPDDCYGHHTRGYIGSYDSGAIYGPFLFDISPYMGETINDASLQLYFYGSSGTFPPNGPWIARYTGSWDEDTITWNNQPGWDEWYYTADDPSMDDWWDIDVTTWVNEWVDSSIDNYGVFVGADAVGSADWGAYYSKEYSDSDFHPKLVLDYTVTSIESVSLGEIKATFK